MESSNVTSLRNFGIELVGSVPWGTHLCQFYESKQDLIDILVPYFAEGLHRNEFCMWVTSPPLEVAEAKKALRKAVSDLDRYLQKGQIEIVSYKDWYLLGGKFDADRVLQGWVKKETDAIKHGFEGLRLTGNTFWIERNLWKSFVDYEEAVNAVIGQHKMLALCTYCLKNTSGTDVVDVIRNHVGTLLKQGKKWVLVENAVERKKEQNALVEKERSWQTTLGSIGDAVIATDTAGEITFMNKAAEKLTGWTLNEASKKPLEKVFHIVNEKTRREVANPVTRVLKEGGTVGLANHTILITKDGNEVPIDDSGAPIKQKDGKISGVVLVFRDITDKKKSEKELFNLAKFPSENPFAVLRINRDGTVMYANPESRRLPKPISVQVGQIARPQWLSHVTEALTSNRRLDFEESVGGRSFEFKVAPILSEGYVNIYGSDITERKKAEEAARKGEAASFASKYARSLIEASLDPLVTISAEGKITDVNNATELVTGCSRQELIGSDFSDYFVEPEKAKEGYQEVFTKGFVKDYPLAIRHRSGKITDVLYNATVYRNESGQIQGIFAAARDVTESKRVMRDFAETKNFLDNILQSSTKYSIIGKDLDHKILSWNEGAKRNYGYTAEEIIGKDSNILHTPEDIKSGAVDKMLKTAYENGVAEGEFQRIRKDGTRFMASIVVTRRNDTNGHTVGYLLISSDISERKQAEEKLKLASQYSRSLIEASLDPLVTINADGKITDVNKATELVTGCKRERLIGSEFSDYFTEPEKAKQGYEEVFTKGFVKDYPLAIRHKSGKITDVLYNATVYRNDAGQIQGVFAAARDVTERKKAEEKLRSASLYSRSLIEASLDPLVTINAEGKITDVNEATEEVTGYLREQLIGSDFSDYFTQPEEARKGYQQVFNEGFVKDYPLAIRHRNGKITDVLYNATLYKNEIGDIEGIFAAARDVTAKKQTEEKLLEVSLYSRSLIEASLDPLVTISAEGKITDVNQATENVTGVKRDQLIDSDFSNYFTEPEQARKGYQQVFTEGFVKDYPLAIRHISGKVTDVLYNATLFTNETGEVQGVFAAARDVTERKKAEEQLRTALLYSRTLIESSLDPLVTISADGKITDVNKATEEVTGYLREQLIGSDFSEYFTEPEKARTGYKQVFTDSLVKDYPLAIKNKSGKITDVIYNASVFRNSQGQIQGVFAAARDITERKVMENELRQTLDKLKQSNAELEQFAYVASHDLQEPLRMVASYVQLLQRRYQGKLDAEADEFIAYAVDGANRMRGLIDDLLTYSRVGRLGKPFEPTNLESTLDIVLKNLQASITENKATVTHDPLPVMKADGGQLVQLFQNLIGNAIKFHGAEPPRSACFS